jgi:hypothetical protein
MNKLLVALFAISITVFFACQKERSFELGGTPAQGSLQEDGGGLCFPKTVNGTYVAGTALAPSTNTISVDVNVASAGSYTIYTDTINGYHFRGTGNFTTNGMQTVILNGSGTPIIQGNNVFTVFFDSTECDLTVQVLPSGAGGPATFTLNATGGACSVTAPPAGNYVIGTASTSANTVSLSVNVTAIGTYTVTSTTVQGITFSGTGTLPATGAQTITLTATGTPLAPAGTVNISVTVGSTTCTFPVTITTTPTVTDYFPRTANSNWSYEYDNVSDDSALVVATSQTHTAAGNSYTIFGVTFDVTQGFDSAGYYRKNGISYYRYTNLEDYLNFDAPQYQEFIFIKDTTNGATWVSPAAGFTGAISGQAVTVRMKYTIMSRDQPKTFMTSLGSKTYQDVITVKEEYEVLQGGNWVLATSSAGYYLDYYSKNVGWIVSEAYNGAGAIQPGVMRMRRYTVN